MAKVIMPLMSESASGSTGPITFSRTLGRNVVRMRTTPSNPNTANQESVRNDMRISAAGQRFANRTTLKRGGETKTDKELIAEVRPSGYTWNAYLVENIVGSGGLIIDAAKSAYTALTAPQKTAWNDAAAALTPAISAVVQTEAGGTPTTPMPAGEVFFCYVYGLSQIGVADAPTGTPPTYA